MLRFVTVLAVVAVVAGAAEKPAADPPGAASSEDPLAAAKREFQSIKNVRDDLARPSGLELPRLSTPELQLSASPPSVAPAVPTRPTDGRKSANWLVDGALKKSEPGPHDRAQRDDFSVSSGRDLRASGLEERSGRREDTRKAELGKDKPADPKNNPLARYMAGWMTEKDYALLRPDLGGAMDPTFAMAGGTEALFSVPGSTPRGGAEGNLAPGMSRTGSISRSPSATRENPFLESFNTPLPATSRLVAVSGPATTSPSPAIAPVEPLPTRAKLPDIAKPSDDTKYFKQLKRF